MSEPNTVVIGAGHNGLVAGALLGRAGRRVVILEARDTMGGLAAEDTFHPGYRSPGFLHDTCGLSPSVVRSLHLVSHGLTLRKARAPVYVPTLNGPALFVGERPPTVSAGLKSHAPQDVEGLAAWRRFIGKVSGVVGSWIDRPCADLGAPTLRLAGPLLRTGLALRRLGRRDMAELLRVVPMSASDWLGEHLCCEPLKAALLGPALVGTWMGPRSAGSAANLLFHACSEGPTVVGGPAAVIRSLRAACRDQGARIRTRAPVSGLLMKNGRTAGVVLESGEEIPAETVVSSLDPVRTLLELVPPRDRPPELLDSLSSWRCRGTTAKLTLALDGALDFRQHPGEPFERIHVGESLDELERAFDAVKYGALPERPFLDVRIPTIESPDLAPREHHVVSILIHFVPNEPTGGWTSALRDELLRRTLDHLGQFAPAVSDRIVAHQLLTPPDIAQRFGITGGHVHHGEHALDQLLSLRPDPALSGHGTPIPGLFLCGAGTHPGGGISGRPGMLAAMRVLSS